MNYKVQNDTRPINVLYDKAFTAVNAPNVLHKAVVNFQEPFQPRSRYPEGLPPVRYPDVTTIGGFLEDPREDDNDARAMAAAMAERVDPTNLFPIQHDSQAVYKVDFQKPKEGTMDRSEMVKRILLPGKDTKVKTGWDE